MRTSSSLLLALLLTATLGCSTRSAPDDSAAEASATPAEATAAPEPPAAAEPAAAEPAAEPAEQPEKQPLSHYLATATTAKVYDSTNPRDTKLVKTLVGDATRAYLARFDLAQLADGPLVRCPPTEVYAFEDAAGTKLGSISFCGDHARFDAPDGTFGGIDGPAAP